MTHWHILTPEYPPQIGGVADYSRSVAGELARRGSSVRVWCPAGEAPRPAEAAFCVSEIPGGYSPRGLKYLEQQLSTLPAPRRLFVQWVPHGFGRRALNLRFCTWLWQRRQAGDEVDLMIHEPFLMFGEGSWRQDAVAVVHRVMMTILLQAAARVWISIPAWEEKIRPWLWGRPLRVRWLPVPANILPAAAQGAGAPLPFSRTGPLLGHFGTYGREAAELLAAVLQEPALLNSGCNVALLGKGSDPFAAKLLGAQPRWGGRLHGFGIQDSSALSATLQACDVMLQPYIDGISSRRSSAMAALAHGKPLVSTSGPPTEEVWKDGTAVLLRGRRDLAGLAATAAQLLADAAAQARYGAAGLDLYNRQFALARVVDRIEQAEL